MQIKYSSCITVFHIRDEHRQSMTLGDFLYKVKVDRLIPYDIITISIYLQEVV